MLSIRNIITPRLRFVPNKKNKKKTKEGGVLNANALSICGVDHMIK